jgi:ADP-ribosylglycohydrolase
VNEQDARFSLVAGEGDGAILGLAAGDTAGGSWELGYSAITEQVTVISYHLIQTGFIDEASVVRSILEMDGVDGEESVYRAESADFRAWLDTARSAGPRPTARPSLDAAARAIPLGLVFRRDPEALRAEAMLLGRIFHSDLSSIVAGLVAAGAIAASCFGQSGVDLVAGVVELVGGALEHTDEGNGRDLLGELRNLIPEVGVTDAAAALAAVGAGPDRDPWDLVKTGLLLAAPVTERAHVPIENAARIGGGPLGAMVGGIVGARLGIRAWPWAFANDTWFAEIGRRLVRGPQEVDDLPIPYAVERHLIEGERQGLL